MWQFFTKHSGVLRRHFFKMTKWIFSSKSAWERFQCFTTVSPREHIINPLAHNGVGSPLAQSPFELIAACDNCMVIFLLFSHYLTGFPGRPLTGLYPDKYEDDAAFVGFLCSIHFKTKIHSTVFSSIFTFILQIQNHDQFSKQQLHPLFAENNAVFQDGWNEGRREGGRICRGHF